MAEIARDTGIVIVATEGTRTYARQLYLWQNRNRPGFNPAWHPDNVLAYHLSGRAVDVGSSVGYIATINSKEFYSRAGKYGFRPTVNGEPWHFEFRPEWAAPGILTAASSPAPVAFKEDEITARLYQHQNDGRVAVFDTSTGMYWHVPNWDYVNLLRVRKVVVNEDPIIVPPNEWEFLEALLTVARQTTNSGAVDTAALARQLSGALLEAVKANAASLGEADLKAIAKAVADETANRLKS